MSWKRASSRTGIVSSFAVIVLALTGCATVSTGNPAKPFVQTTDLHCTLPTNCVTSQDNRSVAPLIFAGTTAEGLAQLRATLQTFPESTVQAATDTTLVAIFTTPAGFRDIVEFRIDSLLHRIDFRSHSSFGLFDFGKNRARMTEFATRFVQKAMQ